MYLENLNYYSSLHTHSTMEVAQFKFFMDCSSGLHVCMTCKPTYGSRCLEVGITTTGLFAADKLMNFYYFLFDKQCTVCQKFLHELFMTQTTFSMYSSRPRDVDYCGECYKKICEKGYQKVNDLVQIVDVRLHGGIDSLSRTFCNKCDTLFKDILIGLYQKQTRLQPSGLLGPHDPITPQHNTPSPFILPGARTIPSTNTFPSTNTLPTSQSGPFLFRRPPTDTVTNPFGGYVPSQFTLPTPQYNTASPFTLLTPQHNTASQFTLPTPQHNTASPFTLLTSQHNTASPFTLQTPQHNTAGSSGLLGSTINPHNIFCPGLSELWEKYGTTDNNNKLGPQKSTLHPSNHYKPYTLSESKTKWGCNAH